MSDQTLMKFAIIGAKARLADLKAEVLELERYIDKLELAPQEPEKPVAGRSSRPRRRHSKDFKLKVVNWVATGSSRAAAAKHFDVAPSVVGNWVKGKGTKRKAR